MSTTPQARPGAGRLVYLDIARGGGILLVVLAHAGLLGSALGSWIYEFYMPLFFVIAGCLYGKSRARGVGACLRRVGRLVREYALTCALLFALWLVVYGLRGHQNEIGRTLYSILYGRFYDPANPRLADNCWAGQLWFFALMASGSALYFVLRHVGETLLPTHPLARRAGLVLLLLAAAALLRQTPVLLPWCLDTAPMAALLLFAGSWLGEGHWLELPRSPARTLPLAGALAAYLLLHDTYDLHMRYYGRWPGIAGACCFLAAGLCGSLLFILLCRLAAKIPVVSGALAVVGRNSLPVFEFHILGIFIVQQVLLRLPIAGWPLTLLTALGCLAVVPLCIGARLGAEALWRRLFKRAPDSK